MLPDKIVYLTKKSNSM